MYSEHHELTKARTELQCIVVDLEKATEASGEKQGELEKELKGVEKKIKSVEKDLGKVEGQWKEGKENLVGEKKL
jgi:structural maintenance of chromosome 3 (chondroitin sulfate proteoglycan 6)